MGKIQRFPKIIPKFLWNWSQLIEILKLIWSQKECHKGMFTWFKSLHGEMFVFFLLRVTETKIAHSIFLRLKSSLEIEMFAFLKHKIDNFWFNPFKIFSNLVANHDIVKNLKNKENQSFILICTKLNFKITR